MTSARVKKLNDWRDTLRPWADQYADLVTALTEHCRSLDDDDLADLIQASQQPTEYNVYWAAYEVAPIVRTAALQEQYQRAHKSDGT